jgi:PAS domain S-box-containing protein
MKEEWWSRLLIESVRDYALFTLDAEGKVATWNRGAELIKGYRADDVVGKHMSVFYTAEDRKAGRPQRLLRAAAEDGRTEDEGWRVRKDGTLFWADVVITALREGDGPLLGYAKVTRDLTSRKVADEALRLSEERLRLMLANVRDYAIFLLDPEGRVASWNQAAQRIKGYRDDEIIGRHFSVFYPPEDIQADKPARELEVAAAEGRFEEESWRLRRDGTRFWANVVMTVIRDDAGRVIGYVKVTRDVTERKRAEEAAEEERRKAAKAEKAVRERDVFLSVAAHELRTPLTALQLKLQGLDQLLRKALSGTPYVEKTTARVGDALRQTGRLTELVERLLDVSRIAAGQLAINPGPVDLASVVRDVTSDFREKASQARTEINVTVEGDASGHWDRQRIEQVVINLVSNAVKYGRGSPVDVLLQGTDSLVRLTIADRGIGISDADLRRIFQPFERAAPIENYGGLGLGLYIARRIVEAHGGRIEVSSLPEQGATFVVTLPKVGPVLQGAGGG